MERNGQIQEIEKEEARGLEVKTGAIKDDSNNWELPSGPLELEQVGAGRCLYLSPSVRYSI